MAKKFKITGVEKVIKNLNREIVKIKGRSMKGLVEAAIVIRRDMDKTPPIIPVDQGNLRASWFLTTGLGPAPGDIGGTSGSFKGPDAAELAADHSSMVSATKAEAIGKPIVIMGFSANYAAFIHEKRGAKFKRPSSGALFMSSSIERNKARIIEIIKLNAKVKK